jgi:hypothetical protein
MCPRSSGSRWLLLSGSNDRTKSRTVALMPLSRLSTSEPSHFAPGLAVSLAHSVACLWNLSPSGSLKKRSVARIFRGSHHPPGTAHRPTRV